MSALRKTCPTRRVKPFGTVLSGHACMWVDSQPGPLRLEADDCYLLTDARAYRTFNAEGIPEIDRWAFFKANHDADGVVRHGSGPPEKVVIGGVGANRRSRLPEAAPVRCDDAVAGLGFLTIQVIGTGSIYSLPANIF
jgi:hypothetical protein